MTVKLDGQRIKLLGYDADKDGVVEETEELERTFDKGITPIKETTELGDALTEFNKDVMNNERLSSIDFLARLNEFEEPPMVALDVVTSFHVLPSRCSLLNRSKMRKSVSRKGEGRKEFVEMVTGKKEQDSRIAFGQGVKNFAGTGDK